MKSYRKELRFNVPTRRAFVNLPPEVESCLRESGVKGGWCWSMQVIRNPCF